MIFRLKQIAEIGFRFCIYLIFSSVFVTTVNCSTVQKEIQFVIYYDYPPFYIEKTKRGLGIELAEHLTEKSHGKYAFRLNLIPKGRLDKMLEDPKWSGVVAWLNPKFVKDETMSKYIWSESIMHEIDYVASNIENPIEFTDKVSLYGHTLGVVLNQRYADVEDALKAGKIKLETTTSQESVVMMLLRRRIEVAFFSKSTLKWFEKEFPEFKSKIHIAKKTRNEFNRHVLLTRNLDKNISEFVLKITNNLQNDSDWLKRFNKY